VDAVTLTPLTVDEDETMKYEIVCPREAVEEYDTCCKNPVLAPFSEDALSFVDAFSSRLFESTAVKQYPELAALAFWMRPARIAEIKSNFNKQYCGRTLLGRGTVFHIAPANVDTLFVYSWFLSMLVGNTNVIRLSSKENPQLQILVDLLNDLFEDERFAAIRRRTLLLRYGHDDEITGHFSDQCDVRVIWGGDATIQHIRRVPIPATAVELPFADKFSLAVIDAVAFVGSEKQEQIIDNFYNDAYWFGQMACSSPRLVVWLGTDDAIIAAQQLFWSLLEEKVIQERPDLAAADVMNKFVSSSMMAIEHPGTILRRDTTGYIHRIQVNNLKDVDDDNHCGAGLFFEAKIYQLDALATYLTKRNQTISSLGISESEWRQMIETCRPEGVDRIVAMGRALEFSVVWDGNDLLRSFCREVTIFGKR
jgi:hypothetical protein